MYARNLLESFPMDALWLTFILSQLSDAGKEMILSFVLSGFDESESEGAANFVESLKRDDDSVMAEWILDAIGSSVNSIGEEEFCRRLMQVIDDELSEARGAAAEGIRSRLEELRKLYRLTDADLAWLTAALCYSSSRSFMRLVDEFETTEKLWLLSAMTGIAASTLKSALGPNSRLVRCGLLEETGLSHLHGFCEANPEVADFVLGLHSEPLGTRFYKRVEEATYPVETFNLPPRTVEILRAILSSNRPCNILLYGAAGSGKTEFAKSIARACGKPAWFVVVGNGEKCHQRRPALVAAARTFAPEDGIVVVDEADGLLNSRYGLLGVGGMVSKDWLNDFLDGCTAQIIWITNETDQIEDSTRRRFTYSVRFTGLSGRQRQEIWRRLLTDHPLRPKITPSMVKDFSERYELNTASIASTLQVVAVVLPDIGSSQKEISATIQNILESHESLLGARRCGRLMDVPREYDLEALHTDIAPETILRALRLFLRSRTGLADPPVNLLFWGPPGTGKTAFAQFLARSLNMPLLVKRASDLLSMWVGGTEKNIRAAFEEAERENAILLLDEADSFFWQRENASRSWELTLTNELLTQMENHHGILVCCTNLLPGLDHAAMRRFAWKVKFLPLTPEGKIRLYCRYFLRRGQELPESLAMRIRKIPELTAGDIRAVSQRFFVTKTGRVDHEEIIAALEAEVRYRRKDVKVRGFA